MTVDMLPEVLTAWGATAAWSIFEPVLKKLALDVVNDTARNYVKKSFGSVLSPLNRKPLTEATGRAIKELLKQLEDELLDGDMTTGELEAMRDGVADFLDQPPVQQAIGALFLEPNYYLDPAVFIRAWADTAEAPALPEDFSWQRISKRFSRKVDEIRDSSGELQEVFARLRSAQDSDALRELSGLPPEFDLDKYSEALIERFGNLSFDSIDTEGAAYNAVRLWNVFVPQSIRECQNYRPQLLELPKEEQLRLIEQGEVDARELEQLERERHDLRRAYFDQTPRPVLEVCADKNLLRLVILGDPGSGKSSLLRFLALEWARDEDANRRYTAPLPLLIELREYNQWQCSDGKGFAAYLHHAHTWHRLNQQTLDVLLKTPGRVLLLLDGLDEIFDPQEREQAINDIHRFSKDYPDTRIILTSRVVGYKPQRLRGAGFQDFMLQDLDADQIEQFLVRWHETTFADRDEAERKRERLAKAIKESRPIKLLAGNPLLLTLMAIINRYQELPRDRVLLYEKAAELLLQQWDTERYLQDFPGLSGEIDLRAKSAILRRIALAMQTAQDQADGQAANIIRGERLTGLIEEYLREELHFEQARAAANALVEQLRQRNFILCFLGGDSYAFVHRTFLEYFCATEFVDRFQRKQTVTIDELLALYDDHCRDDDWQEVLRLICGQVDERFAGQIIAHLMDRVDMEAWDGEIPPPELVLAVWCLSEVRNLKQIDKKVGADLLLKVVDCFLLGETGWHRSDPDDFIDFSEGLCAATKAVGSEWPGKSTFHFYGQYPDHTSSVYSIYQSKWPFFISAVFQQRQWIEELIQKNPDEIGSSCLAALAKYWPDEKSRRLIIQNVFSDHKEVAIIYNSSPSSKALILLVHHWPDHNTRHLITELILQEEREWLCCCALELLAEHWPDDDTRQLIKKQILVNGAAASLYGKEHSRFGQLVFYNSPTLAAFGYNAPRKPIPAKHIQNAAKAAGIPPDKIDETVRSLSEHMGWDITKGSGAGKL